MNRRKIIKGLMATLCILLVLACASCVWFFVRYNQIRSDPHSIINNQETNNEEELSIITYNGEEYYKNPNIATLLFLGIDVYETRGGASLGYRSDMIMICAINTETDGVTLISIPRDTKATVTKMDPDTGEIVGTTVNRINAAFAFGYDRHKNSYLNAMQSIENFINCDEQFDIDLSLYAGIDIDGIPDIANSVGGVTVTLDIDFPGLGDEGDTVTLKGQDAIDYVRERKTVGGDLKRAYRQQQFMIALAKKIKQMGAKKSILALWDKVGDIVDTNLNTDQMLAFATILEDVDVDGIEKTTIPTTSDTTSSVSYEIHDEEALEEIILSTFYVKKS
ncbi:MAG: LCP family protein [Eubacteriales bacterium]